MRDPFNLVAVAHCSDPDVTIQLAYSESDDDSRQEDSRRYLYTVCCNEEQVPREEERQSFIDVQCDSL